MYESPVTVKASAISNEQADTQATFGAKLFQADGGHIPYRLVSFLRYGDHDSHSSNQ